MGEPTGGYPLNQKREYIWIDDVRAGGMTAHFPARVPGHSRPVGVRWHGTWRGDHAGVNDKIEFLSIV